MKLSTVAFFALSSQANSKFLRQLQQCPRPGNGVTCPSSIVPVACGDGYKCEYDNDCLANAAGFVNCLPIEEFCPKPGTGVTCPSSIVPVACGDGYKCMYDNGCLANAAGFVNCLPVEELCPTPGTGIVCPLDKKEVICNGKCKYDNNCLANAAGFAPGQCSEVPPPCNPTTGANCQPNLSTMSLQKSSPMKVTPPKEDFCPKPGAGIICPLNIAPVGCGESYQCVYDNACLANAAGFVGCLPIEETCPRPGEGIICPMSFLPVMCDQKCQYDNACLANAAGYADNSCVKIPEEESCPRPGEGIVCSMNVMPVICDQKCQYDNACLANAAGYAATSCVEIPKPCNPTTGANCSPINPPNPSVPPCNPSTSGNCNRKKNLRV